MRRYLKDKSGGPWSQDDLKALRKSSEPHLETRYPPKKMQHVTKDIWYYVYSKCFCSVLVCLGSTPTSFGNKCGQITSPDRV